MVKFDNFVSEHSNIYTKNQCNHLIDLYEAQIADNSIVGYNNERHRKDSWINLANAISDDALKKELYDGLNSCVAKYCEKYNVLQSMPLGSYILKMQKTEPSGGYHVWHHECALYDQTHRVLVWTIYLNDIKEGGETEFLYQGMRLKPKQGTVSIFPAHFTHTHRGNPPLKENKYILTGWYVLMGDSA